MYFLASAFFGKPISARSAGEATSTSVFTTTAATNIGTEVTTMTSGIETDVTTSTDDIEAEEKSAYRQDLISLGYVDAIEHPASSSIAPVWRVTDNAGNKTILVGGLTTNAILADGNKFRWIINPYWEEDLKSAREFCDKHKVSFVGWSPDHLIPTMMVETNDQSIVSSDWYSSYSCGDYFVYKGKNPGEWGGTADAMHMQEWYQIIN